MLFGEHEADVVVVVVGVGVLEPFNEQLLVVVPSDELFVSGKLSKLAR